MASAILTWSRGGTMIPVVPSTTISGTPPARVATTARSQDMASMITLPKGSFHDGRTNTSRLVSTSTTLFVHPMNRILSPRP